MDTVLEAERGIETGSQSSPRKRRKPAARGRPVLPNLPMAAPSQEISIVGPSQTSKRKKALIDLRKETKGSLDRMRVELRALEEQIKKNDMDREKARGKHNKKETELKVKVGIMEAQIETKVSQLKIIDDDLDNSQSSSRASILGRDLAHSNLEMVEESLDIKPIINRIAITLDQDQEEGEEEDDGIEFIGFGPVKTRSDA
ncbi:hypothetical protein IE53DRAFT_33681 [Violaceomyces palustris]|uniref:Uncharacterized protein n=1 Tax=Violaceomyces palustris TaxID=1673888 RepID=A0ACD0P125_9BASI|nr:hypothetical protein IE53DRAFT_33681 [Violaceomyces palustris]